MRERERREEREIHLLPLWEEILWTRTVVKNQTIPTSDPQKRLSKRAPDGAHVFLFCRRVVWSGFQLVRVMKKWDCFGQVCRLLCKVAGTCRKLRNSASPNPAAHHTMCGFLLVDVQWYTGQNHRYHWLGGEGLSEDQWWTSPDMKRLPKAKLNPHSTGGNTGRVIYMLLLCSFQMTTSCKSSAFDSKL